MSKMKKILSSILVLFVFISLVQVPKTANAGLDAYRTRIKVYYIREDQNYEGWNLWLWIDDYDGNNIEAGHAEEFDGVDSTGAYKIIERPSTGVLGVIVRTDNWEKCYDGDVKIDLYCPDQDLVFYDSTKSYVINDSDKTKPYISANIHYYRFDGDYSDCYVASGCKGIFRDIAFEKEDDFGRVVTIEYEDVPAAEDINFVIYKKNDELNIYEEEPSIPGSGNQYIQRQCVRPDGKLDVYIVQGDPFDYYSKDNAILAKNPKIFSAEIDTLNTISFKTSFKVTEESPLEIVNSKGEKLTVVSKDIADDGNLASGGRSGIITVKENIDFANESYTLKITNANNKVIEKELTLGSIYTSEDFDKLFTYNGELGAIYNSNSTKFTLWAPTASKVDVLLYGTEGKDLASGVKQTIQMTKGENGTWFANVDGDLDGVYYNYNVTVAGETNEIIDPYAKAVGVNGLRAMVIDLDSTDPENWESDKRQNLDSATDATIYEIHVRDFTNGSDSGVEYAGKYNGLWESGTKIPTTDISTAIDHIKELGINTIQIMPTYDYKTVDETRNDQFNWGYDPLNYNALEGSYSTNPYYAETRIKEFKQLVQAFHNAGIRVTMDVVYNHTADSETSNLNKLVPNYYYRQNESGGFSAGSGCGNEIASDRSMVRKMLVDSAVYLVEEYHLDGLRFDLMACLDTDTMLAIREALDKIDPKITIIGEGWAAATCAIDSSKQALKANVATSFEDKQIAVFSDDMRDSIKGHVFTSTAPGFINGGEGFEEKIKFGIVAATPHDDINYEIVGSKAWASQPYQSVNYVSAHDNLTLHDKLKTTNPDATEEEIMAMNKMSAALIYTSQGIAFMLSGEEFARTKVNPDGTFCENSYNAPDSVNNIGWSRLQDPLYKDLYEYYRGLISVRNSHKAFRMDTTLDIQKNLSFLDVEDANVVTYTLNGEAVGDTWGKIAVIFNANEEEVDVELPSSDWVVVVNGDKAGHKALDLISGNKVTVPAKTSYVLVQKDSYTDEVEYNEVQKDGNKVAEINSLNDSADKYRIKINDDVKSVLIKDINELKNANKSLTIEKSNVSLFVPFSAFKDILGDDVTAVEICVELNEDNDILTDLNVKGVGKILSLDLLVYDNTSDKGVKVHNLSSDVTVNIDYSQSDFDGLNKDKLKMAYINDKELEYYDNTLINNNLVSFSTPHFSDFILVEEVEKIEDKKEEQKEEQKKDNNLSSNKNSSAKKTGDTAHAERFIILLGLSLVAVTVLGVNSYKRKNLSK